MPGPYNQYTLTSLTTEISNLLDDPSQRFWTVAEIALAIQEGLYVWGALTSYWRTSSTFNTVVNTAYYDLSVQFPTIRTRAWTLGQMVQDIQFAILENAPGGSVAGTGMSGQTTITAILNAINRARNRFVLDSVLPFSVSTTAVNPVPSNGVVQFADTIGYLHRAAWQDGPSGTWFNLWRQDNYSADAGLYQWQATPDLPRAFSESNLTPLELQIIPIPANIGTLETISVSSLMLNLASAATTFNVPDEWVHAIKWGALAELLSAESQIKDEARAKYANTRYQQAVDFAKNAKSLIRLMYGNLPLMIDTLANVDAGSPTWRNQMGSPRHAGVLYDLVAISPGAPQAVYTLRADVVQSAPIPVVGTDTVDLGPEDIGHLVDYVLHILSFKCGGRELEASYGRYNNFMDAASFRGQINKAKIQYLKPSLEQSALEQGDRPDVYDLQSTAKGAQK